MKFIRIANALLLGLIFTSIILLFIYLGLEVFYSISGHINLFVFPVVLAVTLLFIVVTSFLYSLMEEK